MAQKVFFLEDGKSTFVLLGVSFPSYTGVLHGTGKRTLGEMMHILWILSTRKVLQARTTHSTCAKCAPQGCTCDDVRGKGNETVYVVCWKPRHNLRMFLVWSLCVRLTEKQNKSETYKHKSVVGTWGTRGIQKKQVSMCFCVRWISWYILQPWIKKCIFRYHKIATERLWNDSTKTQCASDHES